MFNEDNTVEQMLINAATQSGWQYVKPSDVPRSTYSVLVESWLQEALIRLNPITLQQAEQVIYKLRAAITCGGNFDELVTANDRFRALLFTENTEPFGKDGEYIPIRFFSDDPTEDYCVVTNQWEYPRPSVDGGKRLDLVYLINGIPICIGEAKSPVRPQVTWADGATDMLHYEKSIPEMFVPNVLTFATEGKELQYAGICTPVDKWGPWFKDELRQHGTIESVKSNVMNLVEPNRLLDIYRYYSVFTGTSSGKKIKIVCRYQQYLGGEAIVQRVLKTYREKQGPKKGLIWHFQGSGKSWLMVFAAQKLRLQNELHAPTVVIVDDRIDLEDQITGDFTRAEIPNIESAKTKEELVAFFKQDQRKILITTIFKFGDVEGVLNERDNIILLVDEAHRTQEKDLGQKMRNALPNAFFFGLTGTPINKRDKNTFLAFGADEDMETGGYISKYTFQNSVEDGATLELNFQTVPVEMHLNEEQLQEEFDELTDQISEAEKNELVKRTSVEAFFTAEKRINDVARYIVNHFKAYVEPSGMKAQVVVYNRDCCVKYKKAIDALLGTEDATTIVMHTAGDKADDYKEYRRDRDQEKKLLDQYRDPLSPIKMVIVTSKLLTGFDAPCLSTLFIDRPPMSPQGLIQAFSRTNRLYDQNKEYGQIVTFRNPKEYKEKINAALVLYSKGGIGQAMAEDWDTVLSNFMLSLKTIRTFASTPTDVMGLSKKQKKTLIKLFRDLDHDYAHLKSFSAFEPQMLEQYEFSQQVYEDYAAVYNNVLEEIRKDPPDDTVEDPIRDDYDLVAYNKFKIDFEYIVELLQGFVDFLDQKDKEFIDEEFEHKLSELKEIVKDFADDNPRLSDLLLQVLNEIEQDKAKFMGQDMSVIINKMRYTAIDTEIEKFAKRWFVPFDAVKYEAYNYKDGELANGNKLKELADYAGYKANTPDALSKLKFNITVIREFKENLMPEISPLIV